jgi:hypothetical protein
MGETLSVQMTVQGLETDDEAVVIDIRRVAS